MEEKSMESLSSLSSHPLFSSIVTLYILILLYFPSNFLALIFSPVLVSTLFLLISLLKIGSNQRTIEKEEKPKEIGNSAEISKTHDDIDDDCKWASSESVVELITEVRSGSGHCAAPNPFYEDSFVEWDVRAPLEVIYEEYEGEGDEEIEVVLEQRRETQLSGVDRYASLSLFYPETDSDSSSDGDFAAVGDWDSPGSNCFRWDEEDREELIEISLDYHGKRKNEIEEDNLIEIDLAPAR